MKSLLYYVTGHGFGHAVRSGLVIEQLSKKYSEIKVYVRTCAPARLFPSSVNYTQQSLDVGVVQPDSLTMDIGETLRQCQTLYQTSAALIETELQFINHNSVDAIAGDIPPLAFEIAYRAGIPSVAITNFTWNEIYRSYLDRFPEFHALIKQMESNYAQATLALSLPYPCNMEVFPRKQSISWIARRSRLSRNHMRRQLGINDNSTVVLLSFGGLGLERISWSRLKESLGYHFLSTGALAQRVGNITIVADGRYAYEDLIQAVDAVVTKPGYGIVADALAHQTPLLYTDRGEFAEYPRLVAALTEVATAEYIPQAELLAGRLEPYLTRLLVRDRYWPVQSLDGAAMAAHEIARLLSVA